jgi:LysR family glycine cleavage system transcriptional activator
LPPLGALRSFVAAARHLSFVRAAAELGVTPGAVSHQVKQLEAWLGQTLFERQANGVALTALGRDYSTRLHGLFDQLAAASRHARGRDAVRTVAVRCQFSLAAKWLAPRLGAFATAHPEIELRILARPYDPDPRADGADLAIYYSRGPTPGIRQDRLIAGEVVVVAAPTMLEAAPRPLRPRDLLRQTLLHTRPVDRGWREPDWTTWFAAAGVETPDILRGPSFNLQHLTLEACLRGGGFALLVDIFAASHLARGELVEALDIRVPAPHAYYLMVPEANFRDEVRIVRDWLLGQAAA